MMIFNSGVTSLAVATDRVDAVLSEAVNVDDRVTKSHLRILLI